MKKYIFSLLVIVIFAVGAAYAREDFASPEDVPEALREITFEEDKLIDQATTAPLEEIIERTETVSFSDLGVEEPGILPTSRFYFFKEWIRSFKRVFAFNPVAKVDLELRIVNQKAAELKKVGEVQPRNLEAIKKAMANYEKARERLKTKVDGLKNVSQNPNIDKLLEKIAEKNIRHEKLFDELQKKFEDKQELRDLIFKNKESLKDTPRAMPEQILSSRCEIWKNACDWGPVLGEEPDILPCAPPGSFSPLPTCPPEKTTKGLPKGSPVDYCALYQMFCVKESPLPVGFCTQQYDPVCGSDGVTYSNLCYALKSGVALQYKGECGKEDGMTEDLEAYNKKLNDFKTCGIRPGAPGDWVCKNGGWKLKEICDPAGAISDNMECEDGVWRYRAPSS